MKRLIFVIAMLSCAAQARQPAKCLELKKVKIDHHLLHQQGSIQAELTFKARNCQLVEGPEKPVLTLEDEPGLAVTVDSIRFGHEDEGRAGTSAVKAKEMSVSVKLFAGVNVPVGEHQLRGIISYQTVNSAGDMTPESQAISIPFKVAPPEREHPRRAGFVKGLEITAEIVVGIPIAIFMLIYCPLSGECPTC